MWYLAPRSPGQVALAEAVLLALPWPEHLERLSALQAALCAERLRQVAMGDVAAAERCFQEAQGATWDGTAAPWWENLRKSGKNLWRLIQPATIPNADHPSRESSGCLARGTDAAAKSPKKRRAPAGRGGAELSGGMSQFACTDPQEMFGFSWFFMPYCTLIFCHPLFVMM